MLKEPVSVDVTWHALVPAKPLHNSKSRLDRPGLAAAFLADTVATLQASAHVARVTVITSDVEVATLVENLGGEIIIETAAAGLLNALDLGMESVLINHGIMIALGDLPCLRTQDVDFFLEKAIEHDSSFTCDSEGTGSTMWARLPGSQAKPRFGLRSRAAHRMHGSIEIQCSPSAHRDVDTPTDLWDAIRIGVGPYTLQALNDSSIFIATISALNPLTAVDESGIQLPYTDFRLDGLVAPRIGQRVRVDVKNKTISI